MYGWRAVLLAVVALMVAVGGAGAVVPPDPSRTPEALQGVFPGVAQLPPGMVLQETGARTEAEIAASFPDQDDAAAMLRASDWRFNAYRVYVVAPGADAETPARLEISLHQFSSGAGAAYALPYFVHARAVSLGVSEVAPFEFGNACGGAVFGPHETTRYARVGDLVIRVTVVGAAELTASGAYGVTVVAANGVVATMVAKAGSSEDLLNATCQ